MRRQLLARGLAVAAAALLLSGCAAPIIAGMTLGTLSTIASVVSTAVAGKDWSDYALGWVTGKDCNVTEGILRKNRKICEERGSLAAEEDFKGIFVAFGGKDADLLQRFASARQEELASAPPPEPARVEPAQAVSIDLARPIEAVLNGVPQSGSNGLARVKGTVVYLMAPIYERGDTTPVPRPRPMLAQQSAGL